MVARSSRDVTVERLVGHASLLHDASVGRADHGEPEAATVLQWGGDVLIAEATLLDRNAPSAGSVRSFLRSAEGMIQRIPAGDDAAVTAAELVARTRIRIRDAADPGMQRELGRSWSSLDHLEGFTAPTHGDLQQAADARLGSLPPASFVAARRTQARESMRAAQHHRIGGRTSEAIAGVYESDLAALEASLVESAVAVGDPLLLTVTIRWAIVTKAIGSIATLPDSVVGAAQRIRAAIAESLGPADGARTAAGFIPLA